MITVVRRFTFMPGSLNDPCGCATLLPAYPHPDPDRPRRRGSHGILVSPVVRVRYERAVRSERARVQKPGGRVLLVEHIDEAGKEVGALGHVIGTLQIDHSVSRNPSAACDIRAGGVRAAALIGIVLISMQVGTGGRDQIAP